MGFPIAKVLDCYNKLMACHLIWSQEETDLHPYKFSTLNSNGKAQMMCHFSKYQQGKNTLCNLTKKMTTNLNMNSKQITKDLNEMITKNKK